MRKCLTGSLILLLLLFRISVSAFAAEAVSVDIPVVIDGGGTAYIVSEVNSPLPTENALRVDNGRTGHFYINFTEVGEYRYTITAAFSRADGEAPADRIFRLTVTVLDKGNGVLYAVAVINNNQTEEKTDLVRFRETPAPRNEPPSTDNPPEQPPSTDNPPEQPPSTDNPPEQPPSADNPPEQPATPPSHTPPRTGDESNLLRYVLLATASSAGLFLLALLYTLNTNKLIKKD